MDGRRRIAANESVEGIGVTNTNPLDMVLVEMTKAVECELNLVALAVAVAVPAICASLQMPNGRSQQTEYLAWCAENLRPDNGFRFLTGEEIYSLRCGLLHQGQVAITSFHKGKITTPYAHAAAIFTIENGWLEMGENSADDRYINSVKSFCSDLAAAARLWLSREQDNEIVQKNLAAMMSYKPFQTPGICIEPAPMAIY